MTEFLEMKWLKINDVKKRLDSLLSVKNVGFFKLIYILSVQNCIISGQCVWIIILRLHIIADYVNVTEF